MALFRNEAPVLDDNAKVEIDNGASAPQIVKIPLFHVVDVSGLSATSTSQSVFVAPAAAANMGSYALAGVTAVFGVAGGAAAAVTVEKTPSGTAAGSGTALLSATIPLTGTANTSLNGTLVTNPATLTLAAGDRLSLVLSGTLTGLANLAVTLYISRV